MKNTVLGVSLIFFIIAGIAITFTIDGKRIRSQEVTGILNSSIESSMKILLEKTYSIADGEQFVADLLQALLLQIQSDSTVQINVLDVDQSKGLLSIEVIQYFEHPNGKPGKVSCIKTVILDDKSEISKETVDNQVKITYKIPDKNGDYVIYKEYMVRRGGEVIMPRDPVLNGRMFLNWEINSSEKHSVNEYIEKNKVTTDLELLARFD